MPLGLFKEGEEFVIACDNDRSSEGKDGDEGVELFRV